MPDPLPKALKERAAYLKNRSIYLLPNLFTTAALFCGFYAIIVAMGGYFRLAAMAIFIAMIFDGLDGRIARWTQTESPFGAEYDSLSDMVSFGVAPALVVYEWALKDVGKLGWAAAFIYCAATALRLARFNTNVGIIDKRYFQGLPSPAAAAVIASTVWVLHNYDVVPAQNPAVLSVVWIVTVSAGLLMISNILYHSGKSLNFRKSVPVSTIMILAVVIVSIAVFARNIAEILLVLFGLYAISGLLIALWRLIKPRPLTRSRSTDKSNPPEVQKPPTDPS